jgi:MFS family permease
LLFAVVGIGWAAINVNSFPMLVEMASGADVGKYTGIYYTFSMAAQIATPLLSGFLIDHLPSGYRILFPYAVVFSALSFVTMLGVRHGNAQKSK